jgi:hypothetical protein
MGKKLKVNSKPNVTNRLTKLPRLSQRPNIVFAFRKKTETWEKNEKDLSSVHKL